VVVCDGIIVGQAPSRVVVHQDPSAHAEMEAIRDAASRQASRDLSGCILYSSSRPCPMCEAAAYWARIEKMVHGSGANDAGRPQLC
jgi:tRNA(Arg) A34 adenosine deaminase TadA